MAHSNFHNKVIYPVEDEFFKKGFELSRQLSLNTKPSNISLVNSLSQSIE